EVLDTPAGSMRYRSSRPAPFGWGFGKTSSRSMVWQIIRERCPGFREYAAPGARFPKNTAPGAAYSRNPGGGDAPSPEKFATPAAGRWNRPLETQMIGGGGAR